LGFQHLLDTIAICAFIRLPEPEAARIGVHHARKFRDSNDLAVGQIADVDAPDDRSQMMFRNATRSGMSRNTTISS